MGVPCRKCLPCRLQRRRVWIARSIREVRCASAAGAKAWFLTLTFAKKPEQASEVVDETQKYFKRLRKRNPGKYIRYVCVTEQGERFGRFHAHALLYSDLSERDIRLPWVAGFSKVKRIPVVWNGDRLDDDSFKMLAYVAGYTTGDIEFPIRASLRYGKLPLPKPRPIAQGRVAAMPEVPGNPPPSGVMLKQDRDILEGG